MTLRALFLPLLLVLIFGAHASAQVCVGPDIPDPYYQDTNGDGIDGDASRAIFVSVIDGNDAYPGTMSLPVKTIEHGVLLASNAIPVRDVYVAGGTYNIPSTIDLPPGVSIYGYFSGVPLWQRPGPDFTVINGASPVFRIANSGLEMHIEGLQIHAANGSTPGQSSYGIHVTKSFGSTYIRYNSIYAGAGAAGSSGAAGVGGPELIDHVEQDPAAGDEHAAAKRRALPRGGPGHRLRP